MTCPNLRLFAVIIALCFAGLCFGLSGPLLAQAGDAAKRPSFAIDRGEVTLPPGATGGDDFLYLTGSDVPQGSAGTPTVFDQGAAGTKVSFTPKLVAKSETTRTWQLDVSVTAIPLNVQQSRRLLVGFEGNTYPVAYKLNNLYAEKFEWSVTPPAKQRLWRDGENSEFFVKVGAVAASNVRLVQTGLVDPATAETIDAPIKLCSADIEPCTGDSLSLSANKTHQLYLLASGDPEPGKYSASLVLVADEKVTGEPIPVELSVTSVCRRVWGIVVILTGIVLALLLGPFNRAKVNRSLQLRPAVLLREQIEALDARVAAVGADVLKEMLATLAAASTSLATSELDRQGLLPPELPLVFALPGPLAKVADYQKVLDAAGDRIAAVSLLLDRGVLPALRMPHDPKDAHLVAAAVAGLDGLASSVAPKLDDLRKDIDQRLAQLAAVLAKTAGTRGLSVAHVQIGEELTTSRIDFEVQSLNLVGWLTFAVISALLGSLVLVLRNPAFGSAADLFTCALWGFGLPVAGQQLSAITMPNVATSLGVNLTR